MAKCPTGLTLTQIYELLIVVGRTEIGYVAAMRKFRILLTLLLCMTIPVAGWASVLSGVMCAHTDSQHAVSTSMTHHDDAKSAEHDQAAVAAPCGSQHQHEGCNKLSGGHGGKPAKGCQCGCGMGTCLTSSLPLLSPLPNSFKLFTGKELFPHAKSPARVVARGTSPLRPPIA